MGAVSAGLLAYKEAGDALVFLLVHPGGPYFRNKDQGFWTIPKGLVTADEQPLQAAIREFQEETGLIPEAPFNSLGEIKQKGGKRVHAWSFKLPEKYLNWDPKSDIISNTFELEWPPRSGNYQSFPEVDLAHWFSPEQAKKNIMPAQLPFLDKAITLKG